MYKHLISIIQILNKTGSSKQLPLPGGINVEKEYDRLIIRKGKKDRISFSYAFFSIPQCVRIDAIKKELTFSQLKKRRKLPFGADRKIAYLDCKKVCFPIIIRQYTKGDWFYPRGMKGRKKVKDLFVDKKIPISERVRVPVLLFGNRIAWVGGFRVDREMAATAKTANILKVKLI
jgi:tRNA(Ile)-lysidine synthase